MHDDTGIDMKATQQQYLACVEIYNVSGVSGVCEYAANNGIDSRSLCDPCDADTPDTDDNCCLVCGSAKAKE